MAAIDRRRVLQWLSAAPLAAGFAWTADEVQAAHALAQTRRAAPAPAGATPGFTPKFFTAHEWDTVRALTDAIIPRDERSGSATDAGVPEFMDFILSDEPRLAHETSRQTAMRGGLAWVDLECQQRFDRSFVSCTEAERTALLDAISAPLPESIGTSAPLALGDPPALPPLAHGRAFFASFRDLVATGFWTTKMGMDDLQYVGNRVVTEWTGCPEEVLTKLGVSYAPARTPRG